MWFGSILPNFPLLRYHLQYLGLPASSFSASPAAFRHSCIFIHLVGEKRYFSLLLICISPFSSEVSAGVPAGMGGLLKPWSSSCAIYVTSL